MSTKLFQIILTSFAFAMLVFQSHAQSIQTDTLSKKKKVILASSTAVGYTSSMIALNGLWYSDFERSPMHSFNDLNHWKGLDKIGHSTTAFHIGFAGYHAMKWAGYTENQSTYFGGSVGFVYLLGVELLDGTSSEWGFSWSDLGANAIGTSLFIGQQKLWNEQRLLLRFSSSQTNYPQYRPELLGVTRNEQILKDYNGQTYWLSAHIADFAKAKKIPRWLMFSVGYGADGMLGSENNPSFNDDGAPLPAFERTSQIYLSVDIDLSRLVGKNKVLSGIFGAFGFLKIPAPTVEWRNGVCYFHPVYW